jgi:hypothetical protein
MIEVKNKGRSPVQLVVRSGRLPKSLTTLIVPGIGKGHNVRYIPDEWMTEVIERVEKMGMISTRYLSQAEFINMKETKVKGD